MPNLRELENAMPVAPLKLIALPSAEKMARRINNHLVEFRKSIHNDKVKNDPAFQGYSEKDYLVPVAAPRFGTGEAKAIFSESIRGKDLFLLVDVCNHSITYKMNGYVNHMSPDDHYQDLKRVIAACNGKAHPRVQNAIPLSDFDNFTTPYNFIKALLNAEDDLIVDKDHLIVISPDEGALDRAIYFATVLGVDTGMFYKRRDYSTIVGGKNPIVAHEFLGDNIDGKDIVIIDDMISSGGSMIDTAKQLKKMNARRVFICCTFGLFTDGLKAFDEAYEQGYFDKVVTTDLTWLPPEIYTRPYFIEADMSKFIASLIDFMNHDVSLANTMAPTEKIHGVLDAYNSRRNVEINMD